jgi:hypothetical protein
MNNKHNFSGYIKYLDKEYFCTISDFFVKMFSNCTKDFPAITGFEKEDDTEEKYLFGVTENYGAFAISASRIKHDAMHYPMVYYFGTPIIIKAKYSDGCDLSNFYGIEFYGGTVNKVFNPRQAIKQSELSEKIEDIGVSFNPNSDFSKEFEIEIDGQKARIIYIVYRYIHLAEQKNEDGSISLGSLNSAVRIKFEAKQPLEMLRRYYIIFNDFLVFLAGRQNVDFDVKLLHEQGTENSHISSCYFRRNNSDFYDGKIYETIQLNDLGDKFPVLFKLFTLENRVFLRFLPENNKLAKYITEYVTDADVLNICTAFDIAFGLDETKDKEKIVSGIKEAVFGKSGFAKKVWFLYHFVADYAPNDKLNETKQAIAEFVKLRNDITHNGIVSWGECGKFSINLIKVLYILTLLRAEIDKDTAKRITEKKWGE